MPHAMPLLVMFCAALLGTGVSSAPPAPASAPDRKNCRDKCGDIHIPYPFGIGRNCSLTSGFLVECNLTANPPTLYTGNVTIHSIMLETAQMVVYNYLTYTCSKRTGNKTEPITQNMTFNATGTPFLLSPTDNMFTAVGCSSEAKLFGHSGASYLTGCITTCDKVNDTGDDGTQCSGHGCCEASITPNLSMIKVSWKEDKDNNPLPDNPCQYAFVAKKKWYSFKKEHLLGYMTLANSTVAPLVLDWAIRNGTCPSTQEDGDKASVPYGACVSTHSYCVNASNGTPGYFCNCSKGYTGNPYIENGCENINECDTPDKYPCNGGICHDEVGDYTCKCKFGRKGDGKSVEGCEAILSTAAIAVIGSIGAISLLAVLFIFIHMEHEKRKLRDRFNKNGGQLLKSIKIEIFTKEKLDKITQNYRSIIGRGAFGEVYKGTTSEDTHVAIKRSIAINEDRQKDFANEITIQSKISHRYLVQLLGCCLETEVPMLVYEFVPKGSLYDVLHGQNGSRRRQPLSLQARLDIAINSADALAYMHSQASQKILHGDVKSGNILLDDNFVPKVSDFGTSRLLSIDKEHTNWVVGDSSYIDPVYMKTGLLTEKSDVYSFGIVLLELITGKKARYDGNNSLPINYVKASREGATEQMYDMEIASTLGDRNCLEEVGLIAVKCLADDVNDRPTMTEVVEELKMCRCQWLQSHGQINEA